MNFDSNDIIFGTILLRSLTTLPLSIYLNRQACKLQSLRPLLALSAKNQIPAILHRFKYNPSRHLILPLLQIPLFVAVSIKIREFVDRDRLEGGFGIWPEMKLRDEGVSRWVMPLCIASMHLGNSVLISSRASTMGASGALVRSGMGMLVVLSLPISAQMPIAMNLYWATSAAFSLVQNLLFQTRYVRKLLKF